jgi:hypothetical protein
MIYFVDVHLKGIFEHGKDFQWQRSEICPSSKTCKVHGHGCPQVFPRLFLLPIYQMLPFVSRLVGY